MLATALPRARIAVRSSFGSTKRCSCVATALAPGVRGAVSKSKAPVSAPTEAEQLPSPHWPGPLLHVGTVAASMAAMLGPGCSAAHAIADDNFFGLHLPPWAGVLVLVAVNVGGVLAVLNVVRNIGDTSEPVTVAKVQIGLLENHPHLQNKLSQLNSMIQVGQVGSWLILEEAILELLKHKSHIAYADVQLEEMGSKKRAYGRFGQMAEDEARKAEMEEQVAMRHGETSMDEDSCSPAGGLWGVLGGQDCGIKDAKEATVVTLVVAARGHLDIKPNVRSWPELRHTLQQLTGLTSDKIMGIELLWTPTQEDEYLTRQQLRQDYPNLVPLQRDAA